MAAKYTVHRRSKYPLVFIEMLIVCISFSYWICKRYGWDWIVGVVIFFSSIAVMGALFFGVRLFRYLFSILFSFIWAFMAYSFATSTTRSTVSPWIALVVVFLICLALHKSYFDFEKDAERIDYR